MFPSLPPTRAVTAHRWLGRRCGRVWNDGTEARHGVFARQAMWRGKTGVSRTLSMDDFTREFQPVAVPNGSASGADCRAWHSPSNRRVRRRRKATRRTNGCFPIRAWWRICSACSARTGVDELDLDRLERLPAEHVADDRRARRQDMPWRAPFKPAAGQGIGAALLVHLEFQSRPDPFMAERMLEYAALLRRDLLRAGAGLAAGGVVPAHLPLVVYNGRAPWNAPLRVEERTAWAPAGLAALQPRFALRLVDASAYKGDHTSDGNAARAWLALDAADAAGLLAALERAVWTLARIGEAGAFAVVRGVVRRRAAPPLRRPDAVLCEHDGDTDDACGNASGMGRTVGQRRPARGTGRGSAHGARRRARASARVGRAAFRRQDRGRACSPAGGRGRHLDAVR